MDMYRTHANILAATSFCFFFLLAIGGADAPRALELYRVVIGLEQDLLGPALKLSTPASHGAPPSIM